MLPAPNNKSSCSTEAGIERPVVRSNADHIAPFHQLNTMICLYENVEPIEVLIPTFYVQRDRSHSYGLSSERLAFVQATNRLCSIPAAVPTAAQDHQGERKVSVVRQAPWFAAPSGLGRIEVDARSFNPHVTAKRLQVGRIIAADGGPCVIATVCHGGYNAVAVRRAYIKSHPVAVGLELSGVTKVENLGTWRGYRDLAKYAFSNKTLNQLIPDLRNDIP